MTPIQTAEYIRNLPQRIGALITGKGNETTDPYSEAYVTTRTKNLIRNKVTENLGDWGWAYSGLMSGADSAINAAIGKGIVKTLGLVGEAAEKVVQSGTLALFGTQAFETSLQDNMKKNPNSFAYNLVEAYIDAGIETATEIWSVENWLADPKNLLTYVGKIGFSEASEEVVGAIVEPYVKQMLGHKNEWNERAKQILADGGYTDGNGNWVKVDDADSATRQAMREWNHEIRMSAQGALMSVFPGAAFGATQQAANTYGLGRALQSGNVNGENNATQQMAEAAAQLRNAPASQKTAQGILDRLAAGKKVGNYQAGRLVEETVRETGEQITRKNEETLKAEISKALTAAGMKEDAQEAMTDLIAKALQSKNGISDLSKKERATINGNQAALNTYMNFQHNTETKMDVLHKKLEATAKERGARSVAYGLLANRATKDNLDPGAFWANEDARKQAAGTPVKGSRGIIYNGEEGSVNARLGRLVKDNGELKYEVYLEGQKNPILANPNQIQANDIGTATVLMYQASDNGFYSQGYTNKVLSILEQNNNKTDPATILKDANTIRFAAFTMAEMPKTSMPANVAEDLYKAARDEYIMSREKETAEGQRNALKPGEGIVRYKGLTGEEAIKEIRKIKNESDRVMAEGIAQLAKLSGTDLTLVDENDEWQEAENEGNREGVYGSESKKGITINLAGRNFVRNQETGKYEAAERHHMAVSFGHEVIHNLQRNSREGYDSLAQYVLNMQREQLGTDGLNRRIRQIMTSQKLDLAGAISELVADSCDQILANEDVLNHIQETNEELYKGLKGAVRNMMDKIRNAMKNLKNSISPDAARIMNRDMKRLAQIFNEAWDEAKSGELKYSQEEYDRARANVESMEPGAGSENGENTRMSVAQLSDGTRIAIEDENILDQKPANMKMDKYIFNYLTDHINDSEISEATSDVIYLGKKLPREYTHSEYTQDLWRGNKGKLVIKNRAAGMLLDAIVAADNKSNPEAIRHKNKNARLGVYRYTTHMAFPVKNATGKVTGYNVYSAQMIVNHTSNGKLELYDIIDINKDDQSALKLLNESVGGTMKLIRQPKVTTNKITQNNQNDKTRLSKWTDEENWYIGDNNQGVYMRNNKTGETVPLEGDDLEYYQAYKRGDWMRMEEMLAEKIREAGAIPFKTPEIYTKDRQTDHRWVSKAIKEGDTQAIQTAAGKMAEMVPKNAVLVPMPNHYGQVEEDTDTMILARMIGWITGRPVVNALAGVERESRQEDKKKPKSQQMKAEDLGFRKVAETPEGTVPYIVDNVIASGLTAEAAHKAMGDGAVTLAYAKSMRATNDGMKRANVTFYDTEKQYGQYLIPLSKRIDMEKTGFKGTKFSKAQLDSEYNAAVKSGDLDAAQEMVEKYAYESGYTQKAYHGSEAFGFTEFDMDMSNNEIFVAFTPQVAGTYTDNPVVMNISDRKGIGNYNKLSGEKLADLFKSSVKRLYGGDVADAEYIKRTELWDRVIKTRDEIVDLIKDAKYSEDDIYDAISDVAQALRVYRTEFEGIKTPAELMRKVIDYSIENRVYPNTRATVMGYLLDTFSRKGKAAKELINEFDYHYSTHDLGEDVVEFTLDNGETWPLRKNKAIMYIRSARGEEGGIYQLAVRPGKQLVVEADGFNWNRIPWYAVTAADPEAEGYYMDNHDTKTREISKWAKDHGYDSVRINMVEDDGGRGRNGETNGLGDIGIFFNQSDVKSVDPVTYDDNGDVIPLSERFNEEKKDIRWSKALTEEQRQAEETAEENGIDLDAVNHTASKYSRASYERSEYYQDPNKMARMLAKNVLGSESKANVAKAKKWIQDVTSISAMIAENDLLDYIASPGRSSFKSNPEYGGSIDSSTICAKRRLQTGTIDAIQRAMPDYVMTAEDFLQVRRMMKERGYEVSCGLCFVESSRKNIAKYASQFMREWNSQHPDNQVNMTQINTVLGLEDTRLNNKEVYEAYEKYMNKLAQRKPKLFEMRSEYNNDIIKHFRNDSSVEEKNKNGGMRINSFSDFEIVHLIDMMQVIMDMGNVGLAGQAYTKVREFAEALGPTGLKINMSMIAAGVDEDGRIIFDEVEGMKWSDVEDLRNKYADNVGTVCVVFTEDQLMAAMADDRIDFIIPFHRSQWNKSNYKDIGLPENVKDFTYWQNERYAKPVYGTKKDGTQKKLRASNYMPNEYWDPNKSGKENAEAYLRMCFENNKIPKFWKWLQSNGDGSFSLKEDGSTDGYWKLLGDFKMYNHQTGEYAAQMPVKPEFDMEACRRMLQEYKGGHESFPEAEDVVRDFVAEKTKGKKGLSKGKDGKIALAGNEITRMSRWSADNMDVQAWISGLTPGSLQTEDEATLLQAYKNLRMKISLSLKKQMDYKAKIKLLEGKENLTPAERDDLIAARNRLEIEENRYARLEDEMYRVTSSEGYAGMMYRENMKLRDYIEGKTQDQVRQAVEGMIREVAAAQKQIAKDREEIGKLAQTQAIKSMKSFMGKTSLKKMAGILKQAYSSTMRNSEIEDRLAEMTLKQAAGQDISSDAEALATDLLNKMRGERTVELDFLRGRTLTIGKSLQAELKAENSNLNELKKKLKGSGVTLKVGDNSRLEEQWNELRGQNGGLVDVDGMAPIDQLHAIVDFIADQVEQSRGINQNQVDFDEVALTIKAAVGNIHTYLTNDPAARSQIQSLMKQIQELSGKTGDVGTRLEELEKKMDEVLLAGQKAKGWTTVLQRDVADAIKYYNKTAAVAAQEEKTKVRKQLIEQLRSENTKKLMEQRDKYEEIMRKDRKARELAQDNATLRNKIHTVASRIGTRLFAETDEKNIPEEAKPLARKLMEMLITNDEEFRHVLQYSKKIRGDVKERLEKMKAASGEFDPETDLDFLVIKAPNAEDNDYSVRDKVWQDLVDIETGLLEYRSAEGQGNVTLADRKAALQKIQEAVSEITTIIQRRGEAFINGKRYEVATLAEQMENEMAGSRFKGERKGFGSKVRNAIVEAIGYGNLTPEYFFKNLRNGVMSLLHSGFHDAEQRSGLEAAKARARIARIAEETGYRNWDGQEKHKIRTKSGEIEITTEQLMALYATWKRESNQLRPEDTAHLLGGGFVLAQNDEGGKPRREKNNQRPIRMNKDQLNALGRYLTDGQRAFVDAIVDYMSGELAELGNEASMDAYGIKKFTEQFYFPIKSWGGVLNKSSDSGITNKNDNRAMRQSFTKRVKNNAANAIEIGDFTPTAMKHIVGMITFNTVGPAVENMNKVLNQQLQYGEVHGEVGEDMEDDRYRMNMRSRFRSEYGENALKYLETFMSDVNGGMTRKAEASLREKLLSLFKKNAVVGSLSVAAQQPLSYIRAAMLVNPKYLAQAISPKYWKGSYKEMMENSGIAVIKAMGKFDMNFGRSMQDWITPEGKISKGKAAWQKISEGSTSLPEKMDAMTWTRMWTACKLEQAALEKQTDLKDKDFLKRVAERFNEVMRKTQVYDSVMVKSQNMRSDKYLKKITTSFMAEPTLSLNVLADAWQNLKSEGGKKNAVKALVTFLLSAAAQAGAKAFFGAGRSPDKKKTREENFWNRYGYNVLSEANPLSLIPGYSQLMDVLENGKLNDDAMGVIGKGKEALENIWKLATGEGKGTYRNLEDSIGQLVQYATDIPLKNFMRDFRAMVNWFSNGQSGFTGDSYAQRETSQNVLKYQLIDTLASNDLIGLLNQQLGAAGYGTNSKDYYQRIYNAEKTGNQAYADEMKEYVTLTSKNADPVKALNDDLRSKGYDDLYAAIDSNKSDEIKEAVKYQLEHGATETGIKTQLTKQYKETYIYSDANEKRKIRDALEKAYKALGYTAADADKVIDGWMKEKTKKD